MSKIDYRKIILVTVATAGILAIVLLAPNALPPFKFFLKNKKRDNRKSYLHQKTKKLIKDGLLNVTVEKGKQFLSLTQKGRRQLLYYQSTEKTECKWDGKWRIVVFDVWEKTRFKRDSLRYEIQQFGFIQLQRSVWVYPYECETFIELLKTDLSFGKNIRYIVAEKLDHDEKLKKYFTL